MPGRRHALLAHLVCALAVVTSAGLFMAAALVPAPPVVLPLVVAVCVGFPMLAAWELSVTRGRTPLDARALARLQWQLDELPETSHPLGL